MTHIQRSGVAKTQETQTAELDKQRQHKHTDHNKTNTHKVIQNITQFAVPLKGMLQLRADR